MNSNKQTPAIRFKGFTDAWEQYELDVLANKFDNLRVPVAEADRVHGPTPYYGANGIQGYVDGYTHKGEFILVAEDGANDLRNYPVQYVNGEVWVNNHAHVLQGKDNLADTRYLGYAISQTNIDKYYN
jgi:type I restriction enzyme S subunit